MEKKIAVVAIIVSCSDAVDRVNSLLHDYRDYIIGRMGIPRTDKGVSVISIVMEGDISVINGLSGKLGMIEGVSSKVLTTK